MLRRRKHDRRAGDLAALLIANLPTIETDLEAGAIVVLDDTRIRIRSLPLHPNNPPSA